MKIGQLSFMQLTEPAEHPYGSGALGSKYQGQSGPDAEPLLAELRGRPRLAEPDARELRRSGVWHGAGPRRPGGRGSSSDGGAPRTAGSELALKHCARGPSVRKGLDPEVRRGDRHRDTGEPRRSGHGSTCSNAGRDHKSVSKATPSSDVDDGGPATVVAAQDRRRRVRGMPRAWGRARTLEPMNMGRRRRTRQRRSSGGPGV